MRCVGKIDRLGKNGPNTFLGFDCYAVGSYSAVDPTSNATFVEYDPRTDAWTTRVTGLPGGLAMTIGPDGAVYFFGGYSAPQIPTANVSRFDPSTGQAMALPPLPVATAFFQAVTLGTKTYLFGGRTYNGDTQQTLEFDHMLQTWRRLSDCPRSFPESDSIPVAVGFNGKIYAIANSELFTFDPATNVWSTGMPYSAGARSPVVASSALYTLEGYVTAVVTRFDFTLKTLTRVASSPFSTSMGAATVLNDALYVVSSDGFARMFRVPISSFKELHYKN